MKKLFFFLSAVTLILSSCSKDDVAPIASPNQAPEMQSNLVKKIIYKNYRNNGTIETATNDFIYEGNKCVKFINSDGTKFILTYNGNSLSKSEQFGINNLLENTQTYMYSGNVLISQLSVSVGAVSSIRFDNVINPDGSFTRTESSINNTTGVVSVLSTYKLNYSNGNLVKRELLNDPINTEVLIYEHDTKNNPIRNIFYFDNAILNNLGDVNNFTKEINVFTTTLNGGSTSTNIYTEQHTYNSINYPIETKSFKNGVLYRTREYIY